MSDPELQKALSDIQASLSNRWWQNILLVLAGAIPSSIVAWITYHWNKNLFYLTKEKEELRIRAEIVGSIKAVEYKIRKTADDFIAKWALAEYLSGVKKRSLQKSISIDSSAISLDPSKDSLKAADEMIDHETEFFKLLAEYNYLVKDKKIDELMEIFKATGCVGEIYLDKLTLDELTNLGTNYIIETVRANYYSSYQKTLENIVNYIMYKN